MKSKQFGNKYFIRLERGEEIVIALKEFCQKNKIFLGTVTGIGATNNAVIGLFKTATKEYVSNEQVGDHEITSLTGSISEMDNDVYLHLHITLANEKNESFGGHLSSAIVSATFEGVIEKIDGSANRIFDNEIGLNLLDLG